jgi:hypothetical protein
MRCKRLKASKVLGKNDPVAYPFRFVVLEIDDWGTKKFSCHWEILPPDQKSYFAYGDYDMTLENPMRSFNFRMERDKTTEDPAFVPDTEFIKM